MGGSIGIYRKADKWDAQGNRPCLASWSAGYGGLDWLDPLVKEGKATQNGNGYPLWYEVKAGDILPLLTDGPPPHDGPMAFGDDHVTPSGWLGHAKLDHARIAQCDPDEVIVVDAWDQSCHDQLPTVGLGGLLRPLGLP